MKHALSLLKEEPNSLERKGYEKLLINFFQHKANRYLKQFFDVSTNLYLTSNSSADSTNSNSNSGIRNNTSTAQVVHPRAEVAVRNSASVDGESWLESLLIITKAGQRRLERESRKYQEEIDQLKKDMVVPVYTPLV
jgi:hypothetical protein